MPSSRIAAAAVVVALTAKDASAIDNGLGLTPPMGWRSWNLYGANVDQSLVIKTMDGMVSRKRYVDGKPTSFCDLGYCDVGLDDNWQKCGAGEDGYQYHDHEGRSIINTARFPNMSAMTEHAHNLGLTAGWYHNNCICMESKEPTPEMYQHDVRLLTEVFKFDGVKLDGCGKQYDLDMWAQLINQSGRQVMIENCHWGKTVPTEEWCPWNFYRTSFDVRPSYGSVVGNLQTTVQWAQKGLSRPGCWAYPDMLEVGVEGLTAAETRAHFGAWCIVSAPLTLSHDVHNDTIMDAVWPIVANKEAIAVNQAWAGHSGSPFLEASTTVELEDKTHALHGVAIAHDTPTPAWQYFYKPVGNGRVAVLMMNHASTMQKLRLDFEAVPGLECKIGCTIRDIWAHEDVPSAGTYFEVDIASHDSFFMTLSSTGAGLLV